MPNLLTEAGIHFGATASSKEEAVALCGAQFVTLGAASQEYANAMWEREQIASSQGDEHVEIIGNLAEALLDEEKFEILLNTTDKSKVLEILNPTSI